MKQNLAGMLLALAVPVILYSCKKAAIEPIPTQAPQTVIENLRSWTKAKDATLAFQKVMAEGKTVSVPQFILLENTQYFPAERINITPVRVGNMQSSNPVYKYLVTELGNDGKIRNGNYYAILNDKKNETPVTITPDLVNQTKIPGDFNGTIIKYDLNNNIIFTKHYEHGIPTNKTGKLVTKKGKPVDLSTGPVGNYAALNPGCEYVYIDWYYQVYVNGVLVYEEYVGTSAVVYCEEGGGSGGSGGGEGPSGAEILDMIFANGEVKSTKQAPITISETTTDITERYPWIIYDIFQPSLLGIGACHYFFISEEIGTKHFGNDGKWHWVSLVHGSIHKVGYSIGITVDCKNVVAVPQIGSGIFEDWATMSLAFDIELSFLFKGIALDRYDGKNTGCTWNVNSAPVS